MANTYYDTQYSVDERGERSVKHEELEPCLGLYIKCLTALLLTGIAMGESPV